MSRSGRKGDLDEVFEILVTSFAERGRANPAESDLCWRPATDVYEAGDDLVVQMELAGLEPASIEVRCDEHTLVVRGERPESAEPGRRHFHTMEIDVGPFVRRVPLPQEVDPATATARYRSGFLYVTFRKGPPRPRRNRKITVDRH